MAYDEGLAQRIRELLEDDLRISEKKMFGGVVFMASGKMAAGIIRDELMVRVGPDEYDHAIAQPHARAMDFTGRPMRGFVQVAPAGFEDDEKLKGWLARGLAFAEEQVKKQPRAKRATRKKPTRRGSPSSAPTKRRG